MFFGDSNLRQIKHFIFLKNNKKKTNSEIEFEKGKMVKNFEFQVNEKIFARHMGVPYEAVILRSCFNESDIMYLVHYIGWSSNSDEWVNKSSLLKMDDEGRAFYEKFFKFYANELVIIENGEKLIQGFVKRVIMTNQYPHYFVESNFWKRTKMIPEMELKKEHFQVPVQLNGKY